MPKEISRITLIDDEPSVLFALTLLLEALGFTVVAFSDPTLAVTHLSAEDPADVCLCDLRMPKLNGLQVLETVKGRHPSLPFVLMSAHANDEELRRARTLGVDGTLSKPFTPDELQDLIGALQQA